MKLLRFFVVPLFLLWSSFIYSQAPKVIGTVAGPDGSPIANASIRIKGTQTGTQSSEQGSFTIAAKKGDMLEVSSIGFKPLEVEVRNVSNITIRLISNSSNLGEVIVVAMDIKRNPRELGYSAQKVSGAEIQETQRQNFINSLQGRVAGLTITPTTGTAGASSSIVLRGFNSLSLSNQPLFIVDGVILDNQTIDENANGGGGLGLASDRPNRNNDYTNRIADLNPHEHPTLTVPKRPRAASLIGSQASSGAIVVTTKKPTGNGRMNISYDNSFLAQKVTRSPSTIDTYSPGSNGVAYTLPTTSFSYFGPAYPADLKKFDNEKSFFKTGFSQTHNLSLDFGTRDVGFRLSGSIFDQDGVIPKNNYKKYSFRLTNTTKIGKYINITPSVSYTHSLNNKPIRGAGGYFLDLFAWPVDNDIRNYVDAKGNKNLLFASAYNSDPIDNPLFSVNFNHGQDRTDRLVTSLGIDLHPFTWLTVAGRFGYDTYKTDGFNFYHPQSSLLTAAQGGYLDNYYRRYNGYNHTITATAEKKAGNWSGRVMAGTMWQDYETKMFAVGGSGLKDSLSTDSSNTAPNTRVRLLRNYFGQNNVSIIREMAYFGEVSIGYKNLVFVDYTHRFESSSTLPAQNRKYNYPGASLSVIVSDIFPAIKGNFLNYAKLRSSLASTARLNDPYSNQSYFVNNFASSPITAYSYYYTNNNADLKPEKQHTYEVGTEIKLFNNIVSVDAAYYNTLSFNQISQNFRASYATGFVLNTQNAASTRNHGIEMVLDVAAARSEDFNWNIRFNFNRTWSKVLTLPASIDPSLDYYLSDTYIGNIRGGLIRGHSTTTITSFGYTRNNRGDVVINAATGLPVVDQAFIARGDRNPKFTLGTLNTLSYKNWSLHFLWDLKMGGDIYNGTDQYLTQIGKSIRTADRMNPRVIKGVLNDGFQNSATPTVNTISVIPYYSNTYYTTFMPEEEFIQKNVNWLRLRDITVSYLLSKRLTDKIKGLKSLSVFATGNDLLLITNYTGADPAVNANTAGSRGVGAFGFDYGSLPTPAGLNFGLRANF